MFAFKPIQTLEIFIAIKDGNLLLLNKDLRVINLQHIEYCFNAGQSDKLCYNQLYNDKLKRIVQFKSRYIPVRYLNNVCRFNGQIFVVVLDLIFVLKESNLELLCEIPRFGIFKQERHCDQNQTWLFTYNRKLYVHNNSAELFELKQNKLRRVKRNQEGFIYFQFCDKLFCLQNNIQIFKVVNNTDFQLQFMKQIDYSQVNFNCNGVVVLEVIEDQNQFKENIFHVLNLLDEKIVTVTSALNFYYYTENNISFGETGYVLESEFLLGQFGPDFKERVEAYQRNYKTAEEYCQFKSFVFNSKLERLLRFEEIGQRIQQIDQRIKQDIKRIQNDIEEMTMKYNLITTRFVELANEFEQQ
ncbi:Hypothetical_protein [Hexamita inflata]|uniref:Hypothetical_protein n=1 Tax=Hexamita inflata TaxID=28002 RepID=A0AA86UNE6_9EUKA|nr:Hypothetical protein HINF_LOCUS38670 [Hexamita inflata]CAI9958332.1 Hypothetical protein HINF_LOCUS45977 [Hexamita inflata]